MTNNNANKSKQLILKKKINIVIIKKNLWLSISKDKFNEFININFHFFLFFEDLSFYKYLDPGYLYSLNP